MTVAILMPTYNEGQRLISTLDALRAKGTDFEGLLVLLVDDGSQPAVCLDQLPSATQDFRIILARHTVNLGQGAALETARQLALRHLDCVAFVTMDSDGQHGAKGALAVARAVEAGADVAFGNRFLAGSVVPIGRRALLRAARLFERTLTGLRLSDAHNGLRGFSRRALESIRIRQNRMAHATEITHSVSKEQSWSVVEVPVVVGYTRESLAKGQPTSGALRIVNDLLLRYLFGDRA